MHSFAFLDSWLLLHQTDSSLRQLLLSGLRAWSTGQPPPTTPATSLATRQTLLGWRSLFEGRPAIGWRHTQQLYYDSIGSSKTGKRWLTQLLLKLVSIAWDLWEVRNGVLHKKGSELAFELQLRAIRDAFASKHEHTATNCRRLFGQGLQAVLAKPPHLRHAWLLRVEASLEQPTTLLDAYDRAQHRVFRAQQRLMHDIFRPGSSNQR